ncbi:MAG: hypothetical protein M1826_006645 [Phylliscum demangeonii]|nr:MAG: hypothetical protein M1826_006645 [Phylliscum demangeonii]
MIPPIPLLDDYAVSATTGFLPAIAPLERLPDPYYAPWEVMIDNLQALLLTGRLPGLVQTLAVLATDRLRTEAEWQRAHSVLAFLAHAYIWGGERPRERLPPPIAVPFLAVSARLEMPPVATYASVVLWNFKPLFAHEPMDRLENLSSLQTFTGALDESWFYLVSVAIEARGAPLIATMLGAIAAARAHDSRTVAGCLRACAERLDELGALLQRMYEHCDPHLFYHRIRPFLAGSKNMADAGLPHGVIYDDGGPRPDVYRQYSGGSAAQSSLIQFFDLVLGVDHRPTGDPRPPLVHSPPHPDEGTAPPPPPAARHNFIQDMRRYMPGPHRRFLEDVARVANLRDYVAQHRADAGLCVAYDASLAMLRHFRDQHLQMVSRYIIVKSRESRRSTSTSARPVPTSATADPPNAAAPPAPPPPAPAASAARPAAHVRGTGGTALMPFLKQARDETGEPAVEAWARRLLHSQPGSGSGSGFEPGMAGKTLARRAGPAEVAIVGLAGTWRMDDSEGGLCHW